MGLLHPLSPNWQTRPPGHHYRGSDPDGFMTGSEVAAFLRRYGADAPVLFLLKKRDA